MNEAHNAGLEASGWRRPSAIGAAHAVLLVNWWYGPLRFTWPPLNYLTVIVALLLPWAVLTSIPGQLPAAVRLVMKGIVSAWAVLTSLLAAAVSLALAFVLSAGGKDFSFERLYSKEVHGRQLSVYRTNGGATTSFGIVLRQERVIFPGLVLVRPLYSVYPGDDLKLTPLSNESVQVEAPPYGERRPSVDVAVIKLPVLP